MRILVEIAYQGNNFLGFQIQQMMVPVQQQFEKLLQRMHKRHVRIHPSSRTDRGVHAIIVLSFRHSQYTYVTMAICNEPNVTR